MTSAADRAARDHDRRQRAARTALSRLIDESGLGVSMFGPAVLGIDRRTLRRWLAGDEIPAVRADWLVAATIERDNGAITIRLPAE